MCVCVCLCRFDCGIFRVFGYHYDVDFPYRCAPEIIAFVSIENVCGSIIISWAGSLLKVHMTNSYLCLCVCRIR